MSLSDEDKLELIEVIGRALDAAFSNVGLTARTMPTETSPWRIPGLEKAVTELKARVGSPAYENEEKENEV